MKKKILTLLALLCLTATGAWAGKATVFEVDFSSTPTATTGSMRIGNMASTSSVMINQSANSIYTIRLGAAYNYSANRYVSIKPETGSFQTGDTLLIAVCYSYSGTKTAKADIYAANGTTLLFTTAPGINGQNESGDPVVEKFVLEQDADSLLIGRSSSADIVTYVTTLKVLRPAADQAIELTKVGANQWTLGSTPAYDVELEVEYYPGMLTFAPNAIEGGTVEVVGLTGDALPAGFEKDAEGNIYVAQGTTFTVKATPEEGYHFVCWSDDETNTNPEREITMPADGSDLSLSATFAENEYDITFSEGTNPDPEHPEWTATPNPAKTKQTVTVTYSGSKKVIGVKAEKKSSAPTLKDALADGATVVITYTWFDTNVTTFTYTNNGGTYTGNTTGVEAEYFDNNMSMDGTTLKFTVSNVDILEATVSIDFDTDTNEYYFNGKGSGFTSFTISVNGTDLTDQLSELK